MPKLTVPLHPAPPPGSRVDAATVAAATAVAAHTSQMNATLDEIFNLLKSRSDADRKHAVQELRDLVQATSAELADDARSDFYSLWIRRIMDMSANANPPHYRLGAMEAISSTADLMDVKNGFSRYWVAIRFNITTNNIDIMKAANYALARALHSVNNSLDAPQVFDTVGSWATERIRRTEFDRYGAVLIIGTLASNLPAYFYNSSLVSDMVLLWYAFDDPKLWVREAACVTLGQCLHTLEARAPPGASQGVVERMYQIARDNLAPANGIARPVETLHGTLLCLQKLFEQTPKLMKPFYKEVTQLLFHLLRHRDPMIRDTVFKYLAPILARYDPSYFAENHHLHLVVNSLTALLRKEKDLPQRDPKLSEDAFITLGSLAQAEGAYIRDYTESIMACVKDALRSQSKKNAVPVASVLGCLGNLGQAVGEHITRYVHDILDLMFISGLTRASVRALGQLASAAPSLLRGAQSQLLHMVSLTLLGEPFRPLGSPPYSQYSSGIDVVVPSSITPATRDATTIRVALISLREFDMTGHSLGEFVRKCAVPYLEDDNPSTRHEAVLTCLAMYAKDPITSSNSVHSIELVNDVLDKVMTIAVADLDDKLRADALRHLTSSFDQYLAQADFVRSLFIAFNDEMFKVRMEAIKIIGRITPINPAYTMPTLRNSLIQLLTDIELSSQPRKQEEACRMLTMVIHAAPTLAMGYALPILKAFIGKVKDTSPEVAASALAGLGELSKVSGEGLREPVSNLVPGVVHELMNSKSDAEVAKRKAALTTLGLFASNTGCVVQPLLQHEGLMDTLGRILKQTSSDKATHHEVSRVLGLLGAIDPNRFREMAELADDEPTEAPQPGSDEEMFDVGVEHGWHHEEYFQNTVITLLMRTLKDPNLSVHHHFVCQSLIHLLRGGGLQFARLPQVVPTFIMKIATVPAKSGFYYDNLAVLIREAKGHIRTWVPDIVERITLDWDAAVGSRGAMVSCIEALCEVLDGEFKVYLPQLLPRLLEMLDSELTGPHARQSYTKLLHSLQLFGQTISEYLRLVVPVVVHMFEREELAIPVRIAAIVTVGQISRKVNLTDHASAIVQCLCRVLRNSTTDEGLRNAAMDTFSALVVQLGNGFAVFIPTIDRVLTQQKIRHSLYDKLVDKLLKGEKLAQDLIPDTSAPAPNMLLSPAVDSATNPVHLRSSWQLGDLKTDEEWDQWMRTMADAFVSEAPTLSIRACRPVVNSYPVFALELFPTAFVACQAGLPDDYKRDLELNFRKAYETTSVPDKVVHFLLNLAEVMEHYYEPLPRDISLLANKSYVCALYAKSLHYKEAEFFDNQSPTVIESLIDINTRLRQSDSALGALSLAQEKWEITNRERWYEKLHRWEDALTAFRERGQLETERYGVVQMSTQLGKMRCLHALSQYQELAQAVQEAWDANGSEEDNKQLAPLGAAAAWSLQRWDALECFTQFMEPDGEDRSFYSAILCTHLSQRERALKHINRARDAIEPDVVSALSDGYARSYDSVVRTQMLAELEEALTYKLDYAGDLERQASMRRTWLKRLEGCQGDVEVWQRMLSIHNLVVTPTEDQEARIKFTNLCRSQGRMILASKTLSELMGVDESVTPDIDAAFYTNPTVPPAVSYSHLKFRWAAPNQDSDLVLADLREFTNSLAIEFGVLVQDETGQQAFVGPMGAPNTVQPEYLKLLARCYSKQGEWQMAVNSRNRWVTDESCDVLESFRRATDLDTSWYKAWHSWAEANFNVLQYNDDQGGAEALMKQSIVPAVTGFFRSVTLSSKKYALQDTLRLLALWFKWGNDPQVGQAMSEGFQSVPIDTWLDVIPQIIARIGTNMRGVRDQIKLLLSSIGASHPQAVVYSLSVATKSNVAPRTSAAEDIVDSMRDHYPKLVEQALVVSNELIRIAVLWPELWHEALEEASRLFHTEHNAEAMFGRLETLHVTCDAGPETIREFNFVQHYGRDLSEAREFARRYLQYGDMNDLNSAWEYYFKVYRRLNKSLLQPWQSLDMSSCSPILHKLQDLELSLPGRYKPGKPVIGIKSFENEVHVISSKQRPRRVKLNGDNGKVYPYLLKGHEDMRQDERVMQLFGLINKLLAQEPKAAKRELRMRRFPVIPLSPNTGMQGWVENTDTMHILIKDYREPRSILLNIEHRLMLQMAPDYEHLPLLQRMEVFMYSQAKTKGQDLYRVLWLRSRNSEAWLDRRINYTRSLGVSAVAGYILGLGDRHPSNLLMDRYTGEVVHIDFGDCFEVAMQRPKYPEKIPFRLTRMLTNAMEVGGIRGTFRITSEIVMTVVRENRASMFTLLEAFVHDPLIGWRLIDGPNGAANQTQGATADADSRNARAVEVINRIHSKLEGLDFNTEQPLDVREQMQRLVVQATDVANLCVAFVGWCSFW